MSSDSYTVTGPDGSSVELPQVQGTMGPPAVDVRKLYANTGGFTFDPGFTSTCSCESAITFIDGEKGQLLYRGYRADELAQKSNYMEVCYLLLNGELPTQSEYEEFTDAIRMHTMLNESLKRFFTGFHYDAHPMAMLSSIVSGLSAFYHDTTNTADPEHRKIFARRMIAKIPTIAAAAYKYSIGQPMIYPKNELDYSSNFLRMMFAVPAEEYEVDPVAAEALDVLLILHADHEQNASTSTVRLAGSTGCNPYAAISSGIAALWGPAHGGANEAVLKQLSAIGDVSNVDKFIAKAKDKNDPFRLMGFGHRVYKNFDPRATVIREHCHKVLKAYGGDTDGMLELAMKLEEIALKDEYFVERKLYPNVDFYSGIIYKAIGIPTNMFTPMFAIGRTVGWVAHYLEMISDPGMRIGRPRQIYTGATERPYTDIAGR
ncbi:citrate synthase [Abyssibacter profundi]|uniref:Citrate synthase n=1 Tax=Abyssibacter profundi TaxID=2182787 RepID=A0A383XRD4_9GAMM|nr:citrate synthase [Abyssibacter profundi]MBV61444.1 citrate (Si)-synthase [Nevskiales bacterium]PWN55188.1 citrate (Si)-synthase [Abyssibacter profundi]